MEIRLLNSDLGSECRDCEGLDDGPGWLCFALGLDAECRLDSSLVAGLGRVLVLRRPGLVKMPFFLTSAEPGVAKL